MSINSKPQPSIRFRKIVAGVSFRTMAPFGSMLLSLILSATAASAADWPSWGGQPSRNMASETEKGLPDWYSFGTRDARGEVDPSSTKNMKWVAKIGTRPFGSPVVSQGRVFIGIPGESPADAALLCLD